MAGLGLQAAYGQDAMQQALRQRIADQIAAQQREATATQQGVENEQRNRQIALQEATLAATGQDRQDRLAETAKNNRISGTLRTIPLLRKGQTVSEGTVKDATESGLGDFFAHNDATIASTDLSPLSRGGTAQAIPAQAEGFTFQGTQADNDRQAALDARAHEGDMTRAAAKERADADRSMRELIARLGASTSAESKSLANELTKLRIQTEQGKIDTAADSHKAAENTTKAALSTIEDLLVHPGFGAASGKYDPRRLIGTQDATDFQAKMNNLVASMVLPNLGALKGPMSDKDVLFLKSMATTLGDERISAPAKRQALEQAKAFLTSKLTEGGTSTTAPAAPGVTVDWERGPDGRPRRKGGS